MLSHTSLKKVASMKWCCKLATANGETINEGRRDLEINIIFSTMPAVSATSNSSQDYVLKKQSACPQGLFLGFLLYSM